jgi:hypothetical protein
VNKILSVIFFAVSPVFADWAHPPVPVNDFSPFGGNPDVHHNSGGRRMVRINGTTIVIAPEGGGERTYRSADNGAHWERIDTDGIFSGCLISGPGEMVYHFYADRDAGTINMVKFRYDQPSATIPAPQVIARDRALSQSYLLSYYRMLNAIVDRDGVLYVATHWDPDGTDARYFDHIFLLSSVDGGATWTLPTDILSHPAKAFYYTHLEVNSENRLMATHRDELSGEIIFSRRESNGSWTHKSLGRDLNNPVLLTVGVSTVVVVAQTYTNAPVNDRGVIYIKSLDGGDSFPGVWSMLEKTCGYGDPSAALADNGDVYVAFRSNNFPGSPTSGSCGEQSREKLAVLRPDGSSSIVDSYIDNAGSLVPKTGTRSQLRYQTWFNYGGPLEWIWMQFADDSGALPVYIYYDVNTDVSIEENVSSPPPSVPSMARPRRLRASIR